MSIKRIIGHTVGTPISKEKLKEELGSISPSDTAPLMNGEASAGVSEEASRADHVHPVDTSRMEAIGGMATISNPANADYIPVYRVSDKVMKRVLLGKLITIIRDNMNSLTDKASGYKASLPPLSEDAEIALASDITALAEALGEHYTKDEVNAMISSIPKFDIKVVGTLPTEGISDTTIYLLLTNAGDSSGNLFTEYIYVGGRWEKLGVQSVNLTGYATEEYVQEYAQPIGDYITTEALNEIIGSGEFDGSVIYSGTDIDDNDFYEISHIEGAKAGDYYLNTDTGTLYFAKEDENKWVWLTVFRGTRWISYYGTPHDYVGQEGDFYLDQETTDVYMWQAGGWQQLFTMKPSTEEIVNEVLNALPMWEGGSY